MSELKLWSEMSPREQMSEMIWDYYKEVHGIRPRFLNLREMSEEDMSSLLARLEEEASAAAQSERYDAELELDFWSQPEPAPAAAATTENPWSEWEDHFDRIIYN